MLKSLQPRSLSFPWWPHMCAEEFSVGVLQDLTGEPLAESKHLPNTIFWNLSACKGRILSCFEDGGPWVKLAQGHSIRLPHILGVNTASTLYEAENWVFTTLGNKRNKTEWLIPSNKMSYQFTSQLSLMPAIACLKYDY